MDDSEFERALAAHDAALATRGLDIWIGNEPTFTDRQSFDPAWLNGALGADKRTRAAALLRDLAADMPGSAILRSIGRQYPGESQPRWNFGLYARRDGTPVWTGPPDPLLTAVTGTPDIAAWHAALAGAFGQRGLVCRAFQTARDWRLLVGMDNMTVLPDPASDARCLRASLHCGALPDNGLNDELAASGVWLLTLSIELVDGCNGACVELPAVPDVTRFAALLDAIAEAARESALPTLTLRGFPPPVDAHVSWTTLTPDPAVIELNMAPYPTASEFLRHNRRAFSAAAAQGLAPYRLYYNGTVADSGGGGQITLGGPTPARSPFFHTPELLPRLIRYVLCHPALSYLFAHDYVGSGGQSVRADERGSDAFTELKLALALLARTPSPDAPTLWRSLAPLLTDLAGNSHRADLNIEKLWNPWQPGRGQLGLVEFRAFRMQHTPERAAALAALLRALLALLTERDVVAELLNWGALLHERFALPFYLESDLAAVLADLDAEGWGLAPALVDELAADHWRHCHTIEFEGARLTLRRALEFWPLLGDTAHEQGGSRPVDASTSRLELVLRSASREALAGWQLRAEDIALPLRTERDAHGDARIFGLRYRAFAPAEGLHPTLPAQTPLHLTLLHPALPEALAIEWHEWRPDGLPYDGLPRDLDDARARRAERCVQQRRTRNSLRPARGAASGALSAYALDLRFPTD
jgi:uncharacterized protein (DUF2126 family)